MNGSLMYEMAMQRAAEQRRAAQQGREVREARASERKRRARRARDEAIAAPEIPDFADEMFNAAQGSQVPVPRQEAARGRHSRAGR